MHAVDFEHSSSLTKFINYLLKNVFYCSFPSLLPGKTIEMYKESVAEPLDDQGGPGPLQNF